MTTSRANATNRCRCHGKAGPTSPFDVSLCQGLSLRNIPMCDDESDADSQILNSSRQQEVKIEMSYSAYQQILSTVGSRDPESGGILLGPLDSDIVTRFFFDEGGVCTGSSYSPDYVTLRRKMQEEWIPSGVDMKGFVHSHPSRFDCLTNGDLEYVALLLEKNDDMDFFIAPIVIPTEHRMQPIVVLRQEPEVAREAKLVLFRP